MVFFMKKIFIYILLFLVIGLISCDNDEPNYLEYNAFFKEEKLLENNLVDLPQPNIENSVLYDNDGKTLYLNLTQDEFSNYVKEIADYILAKENVFYKGVLYDIRTVVGPLFIPLAVDVYIPLEDNIEYSPQGECFAFAMKEELAGGWINNLMHDTFMVNILYQEGIICDIDFKYTSVVQIGSVNYAQYDTCAKDHKYLEVRHYPVPNTDVVIDIYNCFYCGHEMQNDHYGDYKTAYKKTIINGVEFVDPLCVQTFIYNNTYSGLEEHIKIRKTNEIEYKVFVNGFEIPIVYETEEYWMYGFIMPKCDIEVEVIQVIR